METMHTTHAEMTKKYDLLADKFQQEYVHGDERGRKAIAVALENSQLQLIDAGKFSHEQASELKRYLLRDLNQTVEDVDRLGEAGLERLRFSRLGSGAGSSIAAVLTAADESLHSMKVKKKSKLKYKAGELTSAGILTCISCSHEIYLKESSYISRCPMCKKKGFVKAY